MATSTCAPMLRAVIVLAATFMSLVRAQQAYWVYPQPFRVAGDFKDNLLMQVGSKQTLRWSTASRMVRLQLLQEHDHGSNAMIDIEERVRGEEYNWTVDSSSFNLALSPVFYLGMRTIDEDGKVGDFETSHYINITTQPVISSSSVTPSSASNQLSSAATSEASSITSMNLTTATSAASAASITPTVTIPTPQPGPTIPTSAAIGLTIGCTSTVIIAAGALWMWFWRSRKRSKVKTTTTHIPEGEKKGQGERAELGADADIYEVAGERRQAELEG